MGRHWDGDPPTMRVRPATETQPIDLGQVTMVPRRPVDEETEVRPPSVLAAISMGVATIAVIVGAFLSGQLSVRSGAMEPPGLPRSAESVMTASVMAKLWPMQTQGQVDEQCEAWQRGPWRQYVTDTWVAHLAGPTGGKINVDRATVEEFIGRMCRR